MGIPALEYWFSISIRRNRKSFMLASLALFAVVIGFLFLFSQFEPNRRAATLIVLLFGIPFIVAQYTLTSQRLRDIGLTGWLALLWIPVSILDRPAAGAIGLVALIVLCSVPGTIGPNRYGPDPIGDTSD